MSESSTSRVLLSTLKYLKFLKNLQVPVVKQVICYAFCKVFEVLEKIASVRKPYVTRLEKIASGRKPYVSCFVKYLKFFRKIASVRKPFVTGFTKNLKFLKKLQVSKSRTR